MRGEQGFIGGNDRFAEFECSQNERASQSCPSDKFRDNIHLWIIDDLLPIGRHERFWNWIRTRFVECFDSDFTYFHADTNSAGNQAAIELEGMVNTTADGAAANHSQIHLLLHIGARRLPVNSAGDNSILGILDRRCVEDQPRSVQSLERQAAMTLLRVSSTLGLRFCRSGCARSHETDSQTPT